MRQRFLIVCEGDTEAIYFDELKLRRRLTSVVVKALRAKTSDPAMVVEQATQLSEIDSWDQVWCVFDIEAPPKPSSVRSLGVASDAGHNVAWSNPCFEVWLLLHFEGTVPPFATSAAAVKRLRGQLPGFKKTSFVTAELLDLAEAAVEHARLVNDRHVRNGVGPPHDNPNTRVGVLVQELLTFSS